LKRIADVLVSDVGSSQTASEAGVWYVDSSVVLRGIVDQSPAARGWLQERVAAGDKLVASRLMELEVRRVTKNAGVDQDVVGQYVDEFWLMPVNDRILDEAIALDQKLGSADAIHVVSALRFGARGLTLATHDRQMATAALDLGLSVVDPVTDDPGRGPVATATPGEPVDATVERGKRAAAQ
jgi:predicted nucleic acid-binding protein